MPSTPIGPAIVTVTLDIRNALAQLDDLERKVTQLGSVDLAATTPEDKKNKPPTVGEKDRSEDEPKTSRSSRFGLTAKVAAAAAAFAAGAISGTAVASFLSGYYGKEAEQGGLGPVVQPVIDTLQAASKEASDRLSNLEADLKALLPTVQNVSSYVRGGLLLGDQPDPQEVFRMSKIFFGWQQLQARLDIQKRNVGIEALGGAGAVSEKTITDFLSGGMFR